MNHDFRPALLSSDLDVRRRAALGAIAVLCVLLAALILLPLDSRAPELVAHESYPPKRDTQLKSWTVQDQASLDAEYLLQSWPDFGSTSTAMITWPQQQTRQDVESVVFLSPNR